MPVEGVIELVVQTKNLNRGRVEIRKMVSNEKTELIFPSEIGRSDDYRVRAGGAYRNTVCVFTPPTPLGRIT